MAEVLLSKQVKFWKDQIDLYERSSDKWTRRGKKLYKRYKDVRSSREDAITRFNVLWSNVQTRLPALYSRDPKPEVERRYRDKDPVGRMVAEVLERGLDYTVTHCNPFGRLMRQALLDYELPGRGTLWARYVPHFKKIDLAGPAATGNDEVQAEGEQLTNDAKDLVQEETLAYEEALLDYIDWQDFGYTWARTWDEVRAVWRRVYLTPKELKDRFGGDKGLSDTEIAKIPLDWSPKNLNDAKLSQTKDFKKAIVYEIWDKEEHKVHWICRTFPDQLDVRDDPLGLTDFFPTPCPMMANLTPDEFLPTPNFTFYQDQANEIDELSTRIASIGKCLKVAGVRDTSAEGLDRLLSEGTENALIPVDGWAALKEKGGLAGVFELLPLKEIAEALGYLRDQRQQMIDDVYQITGLSDIIRGLSEPNETATAQQIKGQFAVLRISDAQNEVQRYCRDLMRILAEILADFDIETLKQISGVKLLTRAEKETLIGQLQMSAVPPMGGQPAGAPMPGAPAPGGGQPPGAPAPQGVAPAPAAGSPGAPGANPQGAGGAPGQTPANGAGINPEQLGLLKEPVWEDVAQLLQNPVLREFRVDIETDSTIRTDEDADRAARMEFITAVGGMIQQAAAAPKDMIPAVGELILFGIRGFKVARNLERVFEEAIEKLADAPPAPDPEMAKIQAQTQADIQIAQIKGQTDAQIAQHKAQLDAQVAQSAQESQAREDQVKAQAETQRSVTEQQMKSQHEQALEHIKSEFESQRTQYETAAKERIAQQANATKLQIAEMEQQHDAHMQSMKLDHEKNIEGMKQQHEQHMGASEHAHAEKIEKQKGDVTLAATDKTVESKEKIAKQPEEAEKAKTAPTREAIKELVEALKESRKPRKVERDEKGNITGIH